ncbi:c-type cytochrome [Acidicapsa ligni]|uniref:c-type cytochrome n=1 Tax=Acidicapsa ligni TaxID=542300 RepID=UPI0021DFA1DB|nr:c-type cytochrome [Acidicapsa ligni]
MNLRFFSFAILASALAVVGTGCENAPGKPKSDPENVRPDQVTDFATLYGENCAACHGDHGKNGAAISLASPVYLAIAGPANLQRVTAAGVPGTMMPGFSKAAGGMLTDQQIAILVQGMIKTWGNSTELSGLTPPAYASSTPGDSANGQKAFASYCARCHGADATGNSDKVHTGSLIDPAYLALVSDQGLRSIILAGQPEQGMPDWRAETASSPTRTINDQEITDIVAWLASHRVTAPGQPYQQHP